jgi:hypothetical protein
MNTVIHKNIDEFIKKNGLTLHKPEVPKVLEVPEVPERRQEEENCDCHHRVVYEDVKNNKFYGIDRRDNSVVNYAFVLD